MSGGDVMAVEGGAEAAEGKSLEKVGSGEGRRKGMVGVEMGEKGGKVMFEDAEEECRCGGSVVGGEGPGIVGVKFEGGWRKVRLRVDLVGAGDANGGVAGGAEEGD
jgi:hypothetical protein